MTTVKKSTRTIAAKLLDDMCANMEMIKSFEESDVDEVAASLQELLDDVGAIVVVEEGKSLDMERLLLSECKCVEIMQANETRHFRECPLREKHPLGPTEKLVARSNELREKTISNIRTNRAYYKRQQELYELWKAAKATAVGMRGTAGEIDALRAWLEVDNEMNVDRAKDHEDGDEKWSEIVRKAQKALAEDAGLHLTIPEDV